jgi:RimJ/RimL family protein N-acetyltransferase
MPTRTNAFGQPVGAPLKNWTTRSEPPRTPSQGHYCRIEPADATRHARDLYEAYSAAPDGRSWTYMAAGPFSDFASYHAYLERIAASTDPLHYAIIDQASGRAVGTAALMRIERAHGVIEIGHVAYSMRLQRTAAGTEAMFLLMQRVFDELGYRRLEWKCDALNGPSRAAALRYGFQFEGVFRQAIVYKERSRDTAWFSIIDSEWPALRDAYLKWLAPDNFDAAGRQLKRLADMIAGA